MRIEHLAYFCEIAHSKSINKAAKNLFLTQPALTSALNALEEELGFRLLTRSHHGVVLTASGKRLLADSEQILAITKEWEALAEENRKSFRTLHIIANPATYQAIITPLILQIDQYYKELNVFSYEAKNQAIPAYLENNQEASIGLISVLPKDEKKFKQLAKDRQWKTEFLLEDQCQLLISPKNPLASQTYITLLDLADLNLAMYPEKDDVIAAPLFKQFFIYGAHFHLSNLENILSIVANNKSVATMPKQILSKNPYVLNGQIKIMEVLDYPQPLNFYLVYRKSDLYSDIYKDIVRLTKKVFLQEITGN